MGKQSKRPGRVDRDVHAAIRSEAAALKASSREGLGEADEFPAVAGLLEAARGAVAAGVPRFVVHKGRTYWLRARLAAHIDVFGAPGDAEPLLSGLTGSSDEHGHVPGH